MSQYQSQKLGFLDIIWHYKFHLAVYIFVVSFISFSALYFIGGVPEELRVLDSTNIIQETNASNTVAAVLPVPSAKTIPQVATVKGELPQRVIISKINVDTAVSNPNTTDNTILNDYLLRGAVRYPGSGTLAQGNMFIFGHSTGLRVVNNQAFKAFNHLKDLNIDDEIKIQSATKEYIYKVISVTLTDSDKGLVDLSSKKNMLTLSTCNVFGEKQERFVVEAIFVRTQSL
jgi:LPXTG-site transpeptidase (sortase) family protein